MRYLYTIQQLGANAIARSFLPTDAESMIE